MVKNEFIESIFKEKFNTTTGSLYAAPGRINLIGEHTDYNDGFVFPGAIDKGITAKINPNGKMKVRAYSIDMEEYTEFDIIGGKLPVENWACYIYGLCCEMCNKGIDIKGFDTVFAGDIPFGAGMSSSAALASCYVFGLNDLFGNNKLDKMELARIGQATEQKYLGINCSITDQFASIFGKEGSLIRLDCRSMEYEYFPFAPHKYGYRVVLLDSMVDYKLADSTYNQRKESCERVSKMIGVDSLRYANLSDLENVKDQISEEDYRRAKFIIEEEKRVLGVCDALQYDDYETVGECMYQTHTGLSKEYEVSCDELDFLNKVARDCRVAGSRGMGEGFGGCTINLVEEEKYQMFVDTAKKQFSEKFGCSPEVYEVSISQGARKIV